VFFPLGSWMMDNQSQIVVVCGKKVQVCVHGVKNYSSLLFLLPSKRSVIDTHKEVKKIRRFYLV
jgi:hypothetical protein